MIKVLCLGDVVAKPGRQILADKLPNLRQTTAADLVIVNGENSAGGSGIDKKCYNELIAAGADIVTLGDHTFRRKEVKELLSDINLKCIAPANYPPLAQTRGYIIVECKGVRVGVVNLLGRTFLNANLDCPFRKLEELLNNELQSVKIVIVDFHGEATSEKLAFSRHFDGRASVIFGTHTHVQTADEEVTLNGTARITDLGMCGAQGGVIGMDTEVAVQRFIDGKPSAYKESLLDPSIKGIEVEIDEITGKALMIKRISS